MDSEQPTPVAALSWVLELPRDLGLRQDTTATVAVERSPLQGWGGHLNRLPDWPGNHAGVVPFSRLRFRRARVGIRAPWEATDQTYGGLVGRRGLGRIRHQLAPKPRFWRRSREWKTVCQLTRWYFGEEIPRLPDGAEEDDWSPLRTDLAHMLAELDIWLQAYGFTCGEPDIGSISLHDLPASIPWFMQIRATPTSYDELDGGTISIHGRLPNIQPAKGSDRAARMASFVAAEGAALNALYQGLLMLFQADGHALAGQGRQAVIDMGTAVEAVVTRVLCDGMTIRGRSRTEIEEVLSHSWKQIYNQDLLDLLGVPLGQGGRCHSRWWAEHYRTRNEAVHAGARIPQNAALESISDTWELIDWIGTRLRELPDLAPMGRVMERQPDGPGDRVPPDQHHPEDSVEWLRRVIPTGDDAEGQ